MVETSMTIRQRPVAGAEPFVDAVNCDRGRGQGRSGRDREQVVLVRILDLNRYNVAG